MTAQQIVARRIRPLLLVFLAGLVLSGLTAFPLETEVRYLATVLEIDLEAPSSGDGMEAWIVRIHEGLAETNRKYPFLAYGTDWLAFAHLVIAIAFLGPWRDPVRNVWVIDFGLIACLAVIPMALIAGAVRGIPLGWRLGDCAFGVLGAIPLLLCRRYTGLLATRAGPLPAGVVE